MSLFLLSESGLFDFDLTFPLEVFLFFLLSIISTQVFLNPISNQLENRSEFVTLLLQKSGILVILASESLETTINLVFQEKLEMFRQLEGVKDIHFSKFEHEMASIQKETTFLLSQLKGKFSLQSAVLFSFLFGKISKNVKTFFQKKLKSK